MFYLGLILGFLAGMIFLSVIACIFAAGEKDREREDNG